MKKRWLATIALILSLLLIIGGCVPQGYPGGVWDNSKWDSTTWQ